jgi:hypothetical protein
MATIAAPPVTKTTLDVLRDARALYSENPSHAPVHRAPAPGTYCVLSALMATGDSNAAREGHPAWEALTDAIGIKLGVVLWNARHTTEEVLAAFDRAITALEAA